MSDDPAAPTLTVELQVRLCPPKPKGSGGPRVVTCRHDTIEVDVGGCCLTIDLPDPSCILDESCHPVEEPLKLQAAATGRFASAMSHSLIEGTDCVAVAVGGAQTGKAYTMFGQLLEGRSGRSTPRGGLRCDGLLLRTVSHLMQTEVVCSIMVSFLEIDERGARCLLSGAAAPASSLHSPAQCVRPADMCAMARLAARALGARKSGRSLIASLDVETTTGRRSRGIFAKVGNLSSAEVKHLHTAAKEASSFARGYFATTSEIERTLLTWHLRSVFATHTKGFVVGCLSPHQGKEAAETVAFMQALRKSHVFPAKDLRLAAPQSPSPDPSPPSPDRHSSPPAPLTPPLSNHTASPHHSSPWPVGETSRSLDPQHHYRVHSPQTQTTASPQRPSRESEPAFHTPPSPSPPQPSPSPTRPANPQRVLQSAPPPTGGTAPSPPRGTTRPPPIDVPSPVNDPSRGGEVEEEDDEEISPKVQSFGGGEASPTSTMNHFPEACDRGAVPTKIALLEQRNEELALELESVTKAYALLYQSYDEKVRECKESNSVVMELHGAAEKTHQLSNDVLRLMQSESELSELYSKAQMEKEVLREEVVRLRLQREVEEGSKALELERDALRARLVESERSEHALKRELAALQQRCHRQDEEARRADGAARLCHQKMQEITNLEQQLSLRTRECSEAAARVEKLQSQLQEAEEKLLQAAAERTQADLCHTQVRANLQLTKEECARLEAMTNRMQDEIDSLTRTLKGQRRQGVRSAHDRQQTGAELEAAHKEVAELRAMLRALEAERDLANHRAEEMQREALVHEETARNLKAALEVAGDQKNELRRRCAAQEERIAALQQAVDDGEAKLKATKAQIRGIRQTADSTIERLSQSLTRKTFLAVESLRGEGGVDANMLLELEMALKREAALREEMAKMRASWDEERTLLQSEVEALKCVESMRTLCGRSDEELRDDLVMGLMASPSSSEHSTVCQGANDRLGGDGAARCALPTAPSPHPL